MAASPTVKKVVLAYSGGLDTSIILKWLQTEYGAEVVTFTADLGQGEELAPAREKALKLGIKEENLFIDDLREEFVRDYVFPMFRANALAQIGGEGHDLRAVLGLQPFQDDRGVQPARIGEHDFLDVFPLTHGRPRMFAGLLSIRRASASHASAAKMTHVDNPPSTTSET